MIVDLHGSLRSRAIVRRLSSPDKRCVNKNTLRRWRMVWSKKGLDRPLSAVDSYLDVVGAEPHEFRPRLQLSRGEQTVVDSLRSSASFRLGIGWGAKHATKVVPTHIWKDVLLLLTRQKEVLVLLFGMPADEPEISSFVSGEIVTLDSVTAESHIGLPLRGAMTQIASCDVFLSSDSGLMHVADALGVPAFGLFGPTHPALGFAPAGEKSRVFHAGTWCSPCHRHGSAPCYRERRFCFDELDIDEIAKSIEVDYNTNAGKASA
jgi:ADP-heptose:LPS heptosyltransferase